MHCLIKNSVKNHRIKVKPVMFQVYSGTSACVVFLLLLLFHSTYYITGKTLVLLLFFFFLLAFFLSDYYFLSKDSWCYHISLASTRYTSSSGERRIRVHTAAAPVVTDLSEMYRRADTGAIISVLSRLGKFLYCPQFITLLYCFFYY